VGTLVEGSMLNVYFDAESREFNGKWYTNLTAWKVEIASDSQQEVSPLPPIEAYQNETGGIAEKDDLPF
jgi:hypothetical protein